MEIYERIREIRKKNKLSQTEFGKKIGVSRSVISNIEYNSVEPSDLIIKAICAEYGINEEWIRTGKGDINSGEEIKKIVQALADKYEFNENAVKLLENYLKLKEEYRVVIDKLLEFFASHEESANKSSSEKRIKVYRAAKSNDNNEDEITDISETVIEKLKNAPKVDEDF